METENKDIILRHRDTGNTGKFIKEYQPTGKPLTSQIELDNGRIYFAPSDEFEEMPPHFNLTRH